jgi:tetratricopeptide (TPR) repeat protein
VGAERRVVNLQAARADDWFDKVASTAPNFEQLCEAIGRKYVAFALVAGVRITALAIDPRTSDSTQVTFAIGDHGDEHAMALPDFRRALTQALVQPEELTDPPSNLDDVEAVQRYIGVRYLLLAPIFGIVVHELRVDGAQDPSILIGLGSLADEVGIEEFREVIREAVRREEQASRPQRPFAIDLGKIPEAEAAMARGDIEGTLQILEPWAGPLSMLLRTPQGQNLALDAKAALARALGLLGAAYARKQEFASAEEVLRLGVQWVQEGEITGQLFAQLGELSLMQGQPGQGIGLLRRALALGCPRENVLPTLADCFIQRGRAVAALACIDEALARGVPEERMKRARLAALEKVGPVYREFRRRVTQAPTVRAS